MTVSSLQGRLLNISISDPPVNPGLAFLYIGTQKKYIQCIFYVRLNSHRSGEHANFVWLLYRVYGFAKFSPQTGLAATGLFKFRMEGVQVLDFQFIVILQQVATPTQSMNGRLRRDLVSTTNHSLWASYHGVFIMEPAAKNPPSLVGHVHLLNLFIETIFFCQRKRGGLELSIATTRGSCSQLAIRLN